MAVQQHELRHRRPDRREGRPGSRCFDFLQQRIFTPLGMTTRHEHRRGGARPGRSGALLALRARSAARRRRRKARGWMFAAGELAMTASDLAKWDISLIKQSMLKPASYRALETEDAARQRRRHRLRPRRRACGSPGRPSPALARRRGLRLHRAERRLSRRRRRRRRADEPRRDRRVGQIAERDREAAVRDDRSRTPRPPSGEAQIFAGLQKGTIDRSLFTATRTPTSPTGACTTFASSLGPLGDRRRVHAGRPVASRRHGRCGASVKFPKQTLRLTTFTMPDGKLEQYQVAAVD